MCIHLSFATYTTVDHRFFSQRHPSRAHGRKLAPPSRFPPLSLLPRHHQSRPPEVRGGRDTCTLSPLISPFCRRLRPLEGQSPILGPCGSQIHTPGYSWGAVTDGGALCGSVAMDPPQPKAARGCRGALVLIHFATQVICPRTSPALTSCRHRRWAAKAPMPPPAAACCA